MDAFCLLYIIQRSMEHYTRLTHWRRMLERSRFDKREWIRKRVSWDQGIDIVMKCRSDSVGWSQSNLREESRGADRPDGAKMGIVNQDH